MPVKVSLKGMVKFKKELPAFSLSIEKTIAKAAPAQIVANIFKKRTGIFPSEKLPPNKAGTSYLKRKLKKGLTAENPLRFDGVLTDVSLWRIKKSGKSYLIQPPKEREVIVGYLQNGVPSGGTYKILDTPEGFFPDWARLLFTKSFNKFVKKFT